MLQTQGALKEFASYVKRIRDLTETVRSHVQVSDGVNRSDVPKAVIEDDQRLRFMKVLCHTQWE